MGLSRKSDACPQDWRQGCSKPAVGLSSVVVSHQGSVFCYGLRCYCPAGSFESSTVPATPHKRSRVRAPRRASAVQKRDRTIFTLPHLKFSHDNAKLGPGILTFSLPSGHTCPGACTCLGKVDFKTNKLIDGPQQTVRCFSASQEVAFKNLREQRRYNFGLLRRLKDVKVMKNLILFSLPETAGVIRVHIGGDFYSQAYFDAWMETAKARPRQHFYAYTKSIPFWRNWLNRNKKLPDNFYLTASLGGKFDDLILPSFVTAKIVNHPREAKKLKLEIDHDDTHAYKTRKPFALLLHGQGRPGSVHSDAIKVMKQEGVSFSYPRKKAHA